MKMSTICDESPTADMCLSLIRQLIDEHYIPVPFIIGEPSMANLHATTSWLWWILMNV